MWWPELMWDGRPFDGSQLDGWVGIVSTAATLAAVVVAVVTAVRAECRAESAEARANQLETERRTELERAQAARVHAVFRPERHAFEVTNDSDLLVREVQVSAYVPSHLVGRTAARDIPARQKGTLRVATWGDPTVIGNIVTHAVTFRDDGDRYWARLQNGELLRLPEEQTVATALVDERLAEAWPAFAALRKDQLDSGVS